MIRWKRKVEEECGNIPMVLVMTKMDLLYNATIDACEVQKLSQSLAVKLMKTSVKENLNISPVFEFLATQHLSELSQWSVDPPIIQVKILLFLVCVFRDPRLSLASAAQIGGGGFSGCSQQDFLTRCISNGINVTATGDIRGDWGDRGHMGDRGKGGHRHRHRLRLG